MRFDFSELLSSSALGALKDRTFFDDLHALSFTLHPLKKAIADLESRDCTLSDCFIVLVLVIWAKPRGQVLNCS